MRRVLVAKGGWKVVLPDLEMPVQATQSTEVVMGNEEFVVITIPPLVLVSLSATAALFITLLDKVSVTPISRVCHLRFC